LGKINERGKWDVASYMHVGYLKFEELEIVHDLDGRKMRTICAFDVLFICYYFREKLGHECNLIKINAFAKAILKINNN
jgi:hypothetical protein